VEGCGLTLKQRLASGKPTLGTFIKTPHPHVIEVLASAGLDCLCLDAEHAPFDRRELDLCIMAARGSGMPVLVRPPSSSPEHLLNALDCGADGLLIPHVRSASEAAAVARASHYGPGGRGYAGSSRAAGYGTVPMSRHKQASAERTTVIAQIEDVEAVDAINEIVAVQEIDALFIGRIDLTVALGCETPDDPPVIAAVEKIVAACKRAGRSSGMFLSRVEDVPHWRSLGVTLFLLGSDHGFLRESAASLRQRSGIQA
jgi:2-keto-3-deoxy-L-rhamnonate aldolase RhmA